MWSLLGRRSRADVLAAGETVELFAAKSRNWQLLRQSYFDGLVAGSCTAAPMDGDMGWQYNCRPNLLLHD
jgi:hypothetical protein